MSAETRELTVEAEITTCPHCRISSYLQSMANQGYNPLTAIQIALNGTAADMIKQEKGASSYVL